MPLGVGGKDEARDLGPGSDLLTSAGSDADSNGALRTGRHSKHRDRRSNRTADNRNRVRKRRKLRPPALPLQCPDLFRHLGRAPSRELPPEPMPSPESLGLPPSKLTSS
jgi:hypothetical protein